MIKRTSYFTLCLLLPNRYFEILFFFSLLKSSTLSEALTVLPIFPSTEHAVEPPPRGPYKSVRRENKSHQLRMWLNPRRAAPL